jgi:predicted regulator of Ras-like GTPase activity (Roadblock/LC7/MglB family)
LPRGRGEKEIVKLKTGNNEDETEFTNEVAVISSGEDDSPFANLSTSLAEIRKLEGIVGYILRSSNSALIDISEPDKIIPYAILSSEMQDFSQRIAENLSLGEPESMLVEGESIKVICMSLGENKIAVFMEKSATHNWIIKRILL